MGRIGSSFSSTSRRVGRNSGTGPGTCARGRAQGYKSSLFRARSWRAKDPLASTQRRSRIWSRTPLMASDQSWRKDLSWWSALLVPTTPCPCNQLGVRSLARRTGRRFSVARSSRQVEASSCSRSKRPTRPRPYRTTRLSSHQSGFRLARARKMSRSGRFRETGRPFS